MAASFNFYDSFTRDLINGSIDLDNDTFKIMICSSSYTPSQTTHTKRSDLTNEVSGTNYTAGGKALTTVVLALDTTNHRTTFDADDVSWTTVTFTSGRYGVLYKSRGGASSADELIGYVDFGADQTIAAGTFTITWDATTKIFYVTR
jgi:hypothetical protein